MASFNGKVIDGRLNLRSTCSTSSFSPIQIPNGTSIVVETVSGQHAWFATSYGGHDGYVVAEFVAISSDGGTCTVSTSNDSLNIRKTPSTSAAVLFKASKNSTLRLLDIDSVNGWFRVSSSEGTGWASSDYLTIVTEPDGSTGGGTGGDSGGGTGVNTATWEQVLANNGVPALFLHLATRSISERLLPPPPLSCLRRRRIPLCGSLILIPSMVGSVFPAVKAQVGLLLTISPL